MVVKIKKKKKKIWYTVVASKEFNNAVIGEIPGYDPNSVVGKFVSINLMTLVGDPKKQSVNVKFEISNVSEKKAFTEMVSYGLSTSYVKRMVRKAKSKLDDSFILESKDKVKFVVKPFIVTRNKVQKGVLTAIRKEVRSLLEKDVKEKSFSVFINEVFTGKLRKEVKKKLNKIYPISVFELRMIKRLKKDATKN